MADLLKGSKEHLTPTLAVSKRVKVFFGHGSFFQGGGRVRVWGPLETAQFSKRHAQVTRSMPTVIEFSGQGRHKEIRI